jgi:hypothetical protein
MSRISRPLLTDVLRISPYEQALMVPPALDVWVAADPEYRPCGERHGIQETIVLGRD